MWEKWWFSICSHNRLQAIAWVDVDMGWLLLVQSKFDLDVASIVAVLYAICCCYIGLWYNEIQTYFNAIHYTTSVEIIFLAVLNFLLKMPTHLLPLKVDFKPSGWMSKLWWLTLNSMHSRKSLSNLLKRCIHMNCVFSFANTVMQIRLYL